MKLYEINAEIANILDEIDEETGELTEAQFNKLIDLEMERDTKIENTALFIKTLRAEAKAIEDERKKLQDKERAAKNRTKSLEQYLEIMLGGEKYKSPLNSIYYGTSHSVKITDETALPVRYFIPQDPKIDKSFLRDELKNGKEITGAELEENKYMVIR